MNPDLPNQSALSNQSVWRQGLLAALVVVLLLVGAGLVGWLGGGALATSAAEVPTRRSEPEAEPARRMLEAPEPASEADQTQADPVTISDSMAEAGMVEAGMVEAGPDDATGNLDVALAAIDDGSAIAEQQCRDIEAQVALRWDDGRMTDADYESRWGDFLSEDEFATILVPSLEGNGSILAEADRPIFAGFDDRFDVGDLDNHQLISGYDNCYEIELYDFE